MFPYKTVFSLLIVLFLSEILNVEMSKDLPLKAHL